MRKIIILLGLGLICSSVFSQIQNINYTVDKIWDEAPHNAFTDLIQYHGKYFCTFREAIGHVPLKDGTGDGKIRLLMSEDGEKWESVLLLEKDGVDLRDPKLSIMPDGRLMVLIGASIYKEGVRMEHIQYVSFTDEELSFSEMQKVNLDRTIQSNINWLWRVTWSNKEGYGIVYRTEEPDWTVFLVKTSDGINYHLVTQLEVTGKPNESTVEILGKKKMCAIVRREDGKTGCLGYSEYPYTEWNWTDLGIRLGGPDIITLPNDNTIIGTRSFRDGKPYTSLFGLDEHDKAIQLLEFPSGNDTSYPGIIVNGKELWVSYYSGHEGKTSIYLMKVKYEDLFQK